MTMEELLTFVNVGRAARAKPRCPRTAILLRLGMRSRARAASRYASADPSRQITITGRSVGQYCRPLAEKGFVADGIIAPDWILTVSIQLKWGAHAPSRAVVGALAGHSGTF